MGFIYHQHRNLPVWIATMIRAIPNGGGSMFLGVAAAMGVSVFYSIGVPSIIGDEG